MKNYQMNIKTNSTCPNRVTVLRLIEEGKANFKTVIGETTIRGFYPVYVDAEDKPNLYGFVQSVKDGEKNLNKDEILELIQNNPEVKLESYFNQVISATLSLSEVKAANVDSSISPELQKAMDEAVANGFVSQEEIDLRVQIMNDNRVDEDLKIRVVKNYRKYNKAAHQPRTIYVDPFLNTLKVGEEGVIAEGLRCAVMHMPTVCEGEKSVGKNVYMETIAWLMGMPLYMIGFSRNMNPNAIYGEKSTDNSASEALMNMTDEAIAKVMVDGNLLSESIKSRNAAIKAAARFELTKARAASVSIITDASELYDWMTDGGVMVWNEMNMAESNFFSSFANPLTDGTGFLFFPGRGEIKMHKDCVLFGTQNADYEGVQSQNEATLSRFNTISFKQPKKVIDLLKAATAAELKNDGVKLSLDAKYFDQAQKFYGRCMDSVHDGIISNSVLNIRGFVRALRTVAASNGKCNLKRWLEICVVNTCPADEQEAIKGVLKATVTC